MSHVDDLWVDTVVQIGQSDTLTDRVIRDIGRHATAATRYAVDLRLNRFLEQPWEINELTKVFDGFLDYAWLGTCAEAVDRLQAFGYGDSAFPGLFVEWMQDGWTGTYESVSHLLRTRTLGQVEGFLLRRLSEAEQRGTPLDSPETAPYRQALKDVAFLNKQGIRPEFGLALPILGEWGSGKTRALLDLADRARHRDAWVVILSGSEIQEPMGDLCNALGDMLGFTAPRSCTPEDIARRLAGLGHPNLLVVIDDVDEAVRRNAKALDDIQALMARTAVNGSIRWALAADTASLDLLETSTTRSVTNSRYSYASNGSSNNISGWLALDEINERHDLGRNIIRLNSTPEIQAQLDQVLRSADLNAYHASVLNRPTFAWMFVEVVHATGSNLFDLSRDEFVDRYVDRLFASLESSPATTAELRLAIRLIAEKFAREGSAADFDINDLRSLFADRSDGLLNTFYGELLPLLRESGLLQIARLGNADIEDVMDVAVPGMPPVWGRRVSALLGIDSAEPVEFESKVRPWAEKANLGNDIAEAVCEFALRDRFVQKHNGGSPVGEALAWRYSSMWGQSPLLLASIDAPELIQQALAAELNKSWELRTKRDEFAAIRAASLMALQDWRAPERLAALQFHYSCAASSSLGPYLLHVASKLVSDRGLCGPDDFERILPTFRGIDAIGDTAPLARSVSREASVHFRSEPSRWIRAILTYLKGALEPESKHFYPEPHDDVVDLYLLTSGGYSYGRPRSCFWQELVSFTLGALSEQCGVALLGLLMDAGWYSLAFDERLEAGRGRALRKEANVQLGVAFRSASATEGAEFVDAIGHLVEGAYKIPLSARRQRETALFLIRHTSHTRAKYKVRVDRRLWDHILRLRDIADFPTHEQRFLEGLLEGNRLN